MITLHLSAENAASRGDLHTTFSKTFSFPEWYGRNLDALADCLTDVCDDTEISMDEAALNGCLGEHYTSRLKHLLGNVSAQNPHIVFLK